MKSPIVLLVVGAMSAGFMPSGRAATCSCAGVALSSADAYIASKAGDSQLAVTYNYFDLSDLVAGSTEVNDETQRDRATQTLLLRYGYGLSDRWTVGALVSGVRHERQVRTSNQGEQIGEGLGDSLVTLSYSPQQISVWNRQQLSFGLGVRIPTGEDDKGSPLFLEDMQPGQGAWGGSAWVYWARAYSQAARLKTFVSLSLSETGENDREYSFEGETTLSGGISYASDLGLWVQAAIDLRDADPHTRFGGELPNTGGQWINGSLSVQYSLAPDLAVNAGVVLPIHRDLEGSLQFTTRQQFSLGLVYNIQ